MKAKICIDGTLEIERAGTFKPQLCPFYPPIYDDGGLERVRCGDWCPLFVELSNKFSGEENPEVQLTCGSALHEIVSDERKATA